MAGSPASNHYPGDLRSWESPQTLAALLIALLEHIKRFRMMVQLQLIFLLNNLQRNQHQKGPEEFIAENNRDWCDML